MISCDPFADEGGRAGTAVGCTGQQQMMLMELHGHAVKIQYRKLRIVLRENCDYNITLFITWIAIVVVLSLCHLIIPS